MPFENPFQTQSSLKARLKKTLTAFAVLTAGLILSPITRAATGPGTFHAVTLGWNPVPEDGIAAYHVHVGTTSQQYSQVLETGLDMTVTLGSLEYGKTYYFAVRAVDSQGVEGPLSSELVLNVAVPPLPTAVDMATGGTALKWSFPKMALGSSPEFVIQQSSDLVNWSVADTVTADEASGGDATTANFNWAIQRTQTKMFYRMSARNWLGDATVD